MTRPRSGTRPLAPEVSVESIEFYPPQKTVSGPRPGDFVLTHNSGFTSQLIRLGQWLWMWGEARQYTRWNHVAIFVSAEGDIVEALGSRVEKGHISKYADAEYHVVRIGAGDRDRDQAGVFATAMIGHPYGWLTIISIAISILTGLNLNFGFDGQFICSGLVARALERTDAIFPREPSHIMPGELAKYYKVSPPGRGAKRGRAPK